MESPIVIDNCDVEFLSSKANDYKETIYYFKLGSKLKKLAKLKDERKLPFWKTENGDTILKVKSKHVARKELVKNGGYNARLEFVYYDMAEKDIKGYYAKIAEIKEKTIEVMSD